MLSRLVSRWRWRAAPARRGRARAPPDMMRQARSSPRPIRIGAPARTQLSRTAISWPSHTRCARVRVQETCTYGSIIDPERPRRHEAGTNVMRRKNTSAGMDTLAVYACAAGTYLGYHETRRTCTLGRRQIRHLVMGVRRAVGCMHGRQLFPHVYCCVRARASEKNWHQYTVRGAASRRPTR